MKAARRRPAAPSHVCYLLPRDHLIMNQSLSVSVSQYCTVCVLHTHWKYWQELLLVLKTWCTGKGSANIQCIPKFRLHIELLEDSIIKLLEATRYIQYDRSSLSVCSICARSPLDVRIDLRSMRARSPLERARSPLDLRSMRARVSARCALDLRSMRAHHSSMRTPLEHVQECFAKYTHVHTYVYMYYNVHVHVCYH